MVEHVDLSQRGYECTVSVGVGIGEDLENTHTHTHHTQPPSNDDTDWRVMNARERRIITR
jgi:hypothetical protein